MPHRQDPAPESPQIPARPALITLAIGAVLIAASMAGLGGYYAWKASALTAPHPGAFPAPQLETSLQRIAPKEPPANRPPSAPIDRAMADVAARGAQAYDPPGGGR